jgi:hypothetical protein
MTARLPGIVVNWSMVCQISGGWPSFFIEVDVGANAAKTLKII